MRNWIKLFEMTSSEAREVFSSLGVDTNGLSGDGLKKAYRELMLTHHPDKGGDVEVAKKVSAAFDALKTDTADKPSSSQGQKASYGEMSRSLFNLDYVKEYFYEMTKDAPSQMWTVMNFDGHFFRGMFTIRANHDLFPRVAEVMKIWDRYYDSKAVLVGTKSMLESGTLLVIDVEGKSINPFVTLEFDSFNLNPSNDQSFVRKLPEYLHAIKRGQFISQA